MYWKSSEQIIMKYMRKRTGTKMPKYLITRITSWILPGPLLPKKPKAYTNMRKVVYINKFVAGYENLFYLKSSSEKKRLNTNVKRENDICPCTHFR